MTPDVRADAEKPTLEELLERGEVQSALILKGKFSRKELELIKTGWGKAHEVNRVERDRLLSRLDTLERELSLLDCNATTWHADDCGIHNANPPWICTCDSVKLRARLRAAEEALRTLRLALQHRGQALREIADLPDVRCDEAPMIARAALAGVQAPTGEDTP